MPGDSDGPPSDQSRRALQSWKEIASYLDCDVRTAQRREKQEGLPVHRHRHAKKGSVFAYRDELEEWRRSRIIPSTGLAAGIDGELSAELQVPVAETNLPVRPARRHRQLAIVVGVLAVIAAGVTALARLEPQRDYNSLSSVPLTTEKGDEIAPAFSPDGTRVVYASNSGTGNEFQIFIREIGRTNSKRIETAVEQSYSPAWSPSGDLIAFIGGSMTGTTHLMTFNLRTGELRRLLALQSQHWAWVHNVDWSPDGKWVIAISEHPETKQDSVIAVSVITGEQRWLTRNRKREIDTHPRFAPDGHAIAFARDIGPGKSTICVVRLTSDLRPAGDCEPQRWPGFDRINCQIPEWTTDSRSVLFAADRDGSGRIYVGGVDSSNVKLLSAVGDHISYLAVSRKLNRLVFSHHILDADIWSVNLRNGARQPAIASTRLEDHSQISPDGQTVVFESDRSGSAEIWVAEVDGSHARALTSFGGPMTGSPHWSPDGKTIVFDSRVEGQPEIYTVDLTGGKPRRLTSSPAQDVVPCYSRDGRWIYFTSNRTGQREIWKMGADGSAPTPITTGGGWGGVPSPDDAWIYYLKTVERVTALVRSPIAGGAEELVLPHIVDRGFVPLNDGVYYLSAASTTQLSALEYMSARDRSVRQIVMLPKPVYAGLAISPDHSRLFYSEVEQQGTDLMLVEGFR